MNLFDEWANDRIKNFKEDGLITEKREPQYNNKHMITKKLSDSSFT